MPMIQVSRSEPNLSGLAQRDENDPYSTNSNSCAPSSPTPRNVSFARIEVREYERILGDNPSVRQGPALSIGWRYSEDPNHVVTVEDYEAGREGNRRGVNEMILPLRVREDIVREGGYTRREIQCRQKEINIVKNSRKKTVALSANTEKAQEICESVGRKWKRLAKRRSSLEEKELLELHCKAAQKYGFYQSNKGMRKVVSMSNLAGSASCYRPRGILKNAADTDSATKSEELLPASLSSAKDLLGKEEEDDELSCSESQRTVDTIAADESSFSESTPTISCHSNSGDGGDDDDDDYAFVGDRENPSLATIRLIKITEGRELKEDEDAIFF